MRPQKCTFEQRKEWCEANQVCYEGSEEKWNQIGIKKKLGSESLQSPILRRIGKFEERRFGPKDKSEE